MRSRGISISQARRGCAYDIGARGEAYGGWLSGARARKSRNVADKASRGRSRRCFGDPRLCRAHPVQGRSRVQRDTRFACALRERKQPIASDKPESPSEIRPGRARPFSTFHAPRTRFMPLPAIASTVFSMLGSRVDNRYCQRESNNREGVGAYRDN